MTEEGKVQPQVKEPAEEKEDLEVIDEPNEHLEGDPAGLQDAELGKDEDSLKDDADVDYRRKSFHARPYESATVEQTQKEVEELIVKKNRPLIRMRLSKKRKDFEKDCVFHDKEGGDGDLPEKPRDANEMIRAVNETQIQSCYPLKAFTCQTYFNRKVPESVEVDTTYFLGKKAEKEVKLEKREGVTQVALENEEEQRRKRIQKTTQDLESFLDRVGPLVEEALQSNEIINVFQDDFEMLGTDDSTSGGKLVSGLEKEVDINPILANKKISCIRFDPTNENVVAIAYMDNLTFEERVITPNKQLESSIVFWNFENRQNPHAELKLWSPVDITVFEIQPSNPNFVVAGAYNGQILIYNRASDAHLMTATSEKEAKTLKYRAISIPESSHHGPITDIRFLPREVGFRRSGEPAKDFVFFMTVGYDGQILVWDSKQDSKSRDLVQEIPFYPDKAKSISVTDSEGEEMGLMNICLDPDLTSRCFWSNTEDGDLVKVDLSTEISNNNRYDYIKVHYSHQKGYRPPVKLERSPFFPELLFTIHDYHFSFWSQDIDKPLFHSSYVNEALITCGSLSPTRPGVLLLGKSDGKLELWDFLEQSHKASSIIDLQVQTFISALEFQTLDKEKIKSTQYVAVGDGQGVARIFSVPKNFRSPGYEEENNMRNLWRRQQSRLEYMKARNEARRKQKNDEDILRAQEEDENQRRDQSEPRTEEAEKAAQEKEEELYQLFLIKVKAEELQLISKEEADLEKKAVKQRFKHKGDYSP